MATGDLTTLANVKVWVNLIGGADDALLSRIITSVSNFIQSWLNRQLVSAPYTETYDGNGGQRLMLSNYPVTAVASVAIGNITVPASLSPTQPGFTFDQYGIILRGGYVFASDMANVFVTYTGGYVTLPVEIEQAAIELVSLRYAERLRPGVTSRSLGGESVSYTDKGMTDSVSSLLLQYKKVVPA